MRVEAYIVAWNEEDTIHLTIRHYQKICNRIILFDNHSTDGTPIIARAMGCEVRQFGIKGLLSDADYIQVKNNAWKGSTADWVIVVDADEILDTTRHQLSLSLGVTIFHTYGWNVFSYDMPKSDWLDLTRGVHDPNYSKLCIFNPAKLKEIGYIFGCHQARPQGSVVFSNEVIPLFHYRNAGGPNRLIERHALYRSRMSDHNKRWGLGVHYTYDDERRKREWEESFAKSVEFYSRGTV